MDYTYEMESVYVALVDNGGLTENQAESIVTQMANNKIDMTIENACGYIFWLKCNMKG